MHTPEVGFKTGWTNPLVLGSSSPDSPSLSPKISAGTQQDSAQQRHRFRSQVRNSLNLEDVEMNNVVTLVWFATALMENLDRINRGKFCLYSIEFYCIILPLGAAASSLMSCSPFYMLSP